MQDTSKYAVGIDIGTTTIRCVVGKLDSETGVPNIIGVGETTNTGMRKGVVSKLDGPSKAIDEALGEAERMSGYQVDMATISINGSHILSTRVDGMIAVSSPGNEITLSDIERVEEVAVTGKVPANRNTIDLVPFSYRLDGQDGIKDPAGMIGRRLELSANVVSALSPHVANLEKVAEKASVHPNAIVPSVIAAARAVLTEQQLEGGVAVIDFGGSTTSIAVYEEGDLQYVSVIPLGGTNITNDLAICLKTDPEIAEQVKLQHGSAVMRDTPKNVTVKHNDEIVEFNTSEIDEIVEARLEEIFEAINKELDKAGRRGKLPNGVVIVGGGASLRKMTEYAKQSLQLAVRKGVPKGFEGVADQLQQPAYAAAIGLMFSDIASAANGSVADGRGAAKQVLEKGSSAIGRLFDRFRAS
ncbi:MAG: cell division protein FtsA [Candidatus Saccharibacteria bacterium]|nr:cell division protein FtsA [Candidatus Saccharibacteria bacterium]